MSMNTSIPNLEVFLWKLFSKKCLYEHEHLRKIVSNFIIIVNILASLYVSVTKYVYSINILDSLLLNHMYHKMREVTFFIQHFKKILFFLTL